MASALAGVPQLGANGGVHGGANGVGNNGGANGGAGGGSASASSRSAQRFASRPPDPRDGGVAVAELGLGPSVQEGLWLL